MRSQRVVLIAGLVVLLVGLAILLNYALRG